MIDCFGLQILDLLRTIKDPEKPQTLEDLDVVYDDCVNICKATSKGVSVIRVEFNPTVPHCSLATLIGLCIRIKLERNLMSSFKLDIFIKKGAHSTEDESKFIFKMLQRFVYLFLFVLMFVFLVLVNKQINDKERIAAAMENPNLRELVEKCIKEDE